MMKQIKKGQDYEERVYEHYAIGIVHSDGIIHGNCCHRLINWKRKACSRKIIKKKVR